MRRRSDSHAAGAKRLAGPAGRSFKFPSDIAHGHFIHRGGPKRLQQWGLLDAVVAGGCQVSTTFTLDLGQVRLVGRDLVADGVPYGCGPRRRSLDAILVDAAVKAGVDFRDDFVVDGYEFDGTTVTGVRGRDRKTGVAT